MGHARLSGPGGEVKLPDPLRVGRAVLRVGWLLLFAQPVAAQSSKSNWLELRLPAQCAVDVELRTRLTRKHHVGMFSRVIVEAKPADTRLDIELETHRDGRRFAEESWASSCEELVEWVVYTFAMLQDELRRARELRVPSAPGAVPPPDNDDAQATPMAPPPNADGAFGHGLGDAAIDGAFDNGHGNDDDAAIGGARIEHGAFSNLGLFLAASAQASSGLPSGSGLGAGASFGVASPWLRVAAVGIRWQPSPLPLDNGEDSVTWNQTDARLNVCWQETPKPFALRFGACADAGWRWVDVQSPLLTDAAQNATSYGLLGASLSIAWVLPAGFSVEATPQILIMPTAPPIRATPLTPDFAPQRVELSLGLGVTWTAG